VFRLASQLLARIRTILDTGVAFIDVQRAVTGAPGAVIGVEPLGLPPPAGAPGTIEVVFSADERLNYGTVSVIDRNAAFQSAFANSAVAGQIPVGLDPVGLAVSKDGAHLYTTNEFARPGSAGYSPVRAKYRLAPGTTALAPEGTIVVVDIGIAEVTPSSSVISRALARLYPGPHRAHGSRESRSRLRTGSRSPASPGGALVEGLVERGGRRVTARLP
jgi:DNA-binding beta-propeller fold protein YncE